MKTAKWFLNLIIVVSTTATPQLAKAASVLPETFNFSGQLLNSSSTPNTSAAVLFNVKIYGPSVTPCLLYEEDQTLDLSTTNGHFALAVGSGVRTGADPTLSMTTVFDNKAIAKTCGAGGPYTPGANDNRKLVVAVDDGTNPREILAAQDINMVPFAKVADTIRGFEFPLADGTNGQVLTTNGSGLLSWSTAAGGSGTVTSVSGTAPIAVATGTTTPVISMARASTTVDGYLGSTDWTVFNNKQAAGNYILSLTGDVTATGPNAAAATIAAGAVNSAKIADGTIATADIADNAISGVKIADNAITSAKINDGTISPADIAGCTNPNEVLQWSGTAWVCSTSLLYGSQAVNTVLAGPPTGVAGVPTFRVLVGADIPGLDWAKITSGRPTTVSGYGITDAVKNSGSTPSIQSGLDASKSAPSAGTIGRLYIASDTQKIYQDTGTAWVEISPTTGGGGTVTNIATGTGLTGGPITNTGTLSVDVGTTANKIVQLDSSAQLPIVSGVNLTNLNATNLASGSVPAARMPAFAGDVTTTAGSLTTTITNSAVTSAKIADGTVGAIDLTNASITPAKMDIAGSMAVNTGLLVSNGSQFFNKVCASNEALIWTVVSGWVCSPVVSSLAGQTGISQSFATGTSGTAPAWSSASNTHTLNIPLASATSVSAGLISKTDYDSFAAKLSTTDATDVNTVSKIVKRSATGGFAAGDVTLTTLSVSGSMAANTATVSGSTTVGSLDFTSGAGSRTIQSTTATLMVMSGSDLFLKPGTANTVTVGSTGDGSATVVQSGTGKVKIGSMGAAFTAMGACTTTSGIASTAWTTISCTGLPALANIAVSCSHASASFGIGTHCRSSGTAAQAQCTATAVISSGSITCMWLQP